MSVTAFPNDPTDSPHEASSGHLQTGDPCQPLSPREWEVLEYIASGQSNQEIAQSMFLSVNTIKTYIRSAYHKIGAASRSQAVIWMLRGTESRPESPGLRLIPLSEDRAADE